ncbi:MFS transporter [Kineococcus sp. T13]|uniref:MFS transporter n=1 Tax=Kineococcus vitellinus TaxID=2696565 RepID=UPI0014129CD0|nr:MFS transporter [Kineococcus vitellinus]NAZ75699.1 MFS transporter [Kineococcus vitellinus]
MNPSATLQTPPRTTARQRGALAVLVLPVLLISVDMTVLSFALPEISTALAPTGTQLLWIVDGYSLAIAGLLVTMGGLGDRFGARRLLLVGGIAFGLVSALAAFAPSAAALVAGRVALGVAGATLMPSTLSLLKSTFTHREQRRTAFAVWAGGFAAGGALGPIVGGWLLEHFWWGSVFLLNVPFMVLLLVLVPLFVDESATRSTARIDLASVGLSVLALTGLVHGVKHLASEGLDTTTALTLAVGAGAGAVFVRRQLRLAHPLLDVELFRLPVFRASVLANLMSICGMTGMLYAVSQHLQLVLGLRPVVAGLVLLPGAVAAFACGLLAARLARRLRLEVLVCTGLLLGTAGYAVLATLGAGTGAAAVAQLAAAFVVLSAGAGLAETLTNDAILSAAPAQRSGAASAISETAYEVGAVLGTTVLGSLLNAVYRDGVRVPASASTEQAGAARETLGGAVEVAGALPDGAALLESAREAFTSGLDATALAGAALTAGAALVVWRTLRPSRGVGAPARA